MSSLTISLSLGGQRSGGGGPVPPHAPTVLSAPTISLSGTTATIVLGTFSGATSETHVLLVDSVSVGPVSAGSLDVSAYAGSTLNVRSTGTNAGGSTVSTSAPVVVPEAAITATDFRIVITGTVGGPSFTSPGIAEAYFFGSSLTKIAGTWDIRVEGSASYYNPTTALNDGNLTADAVLGSLGFSGNRNLYFKATAAFSPVKLQFAQSNSNTGPAIFDVYYKDAGGSWALLRSFTSATYTSGVMTDFSLLPPAPEVMPVTSLWMNESTIAQYNSAGQFRDLGLRTEWRDTSSHYILARDVSKGATSNIESDGVGSATTVKMDYDGRIYKDNGCAGLSQIRLFLPSELPTGAYTIALVPGLGTVTANYGASASSGFSYDNGTGLAIINLVSGDISTGAYTTLTINVAAIPTGGLPRPTITLNSDAHPERVWADLAVSNIATVASGLRLMTPRRVNNDTIPGSTTTAFALRTAAMRWTGSAAMGAISAELAVAGCNQASIGLWWNFSHLDDDDLIAAEGAILATIDPTKPVHIEWSNELWNGGFTQGTSVRLMGCRRGFAEAGISTVAAAVTKTIIDARPLVNRNTRVTSAPFLANDLLYVDQNGIGWSVFKVISDQASGVTMPKGVTDANFELIYDTSATLLAMKRYQATRTKEIKAILDPIFTAAGRPLPIYELGYWAVFNFANVQPVLDWDETWRIKPHLAPAWYWGGNMGTYADTSTIGYGDVQRDLAYVDMTAHVAAFYAAAPAVVDASIAGSKAARDAAKAYALTKGLDQNDLQIDQYEISWHVIADGWPDQAAAWDAVTAYSNKQFVRGSDGQTYRWKGAYRGDWAAGVAYGANDTFRYSNVTYMVTTAHTSSAGSLPPNANCTATMPVNLDPTNGVNAAYWGVFVDGNGTTWTKANSDKYRGISPAGATYARRSFNALTRAQGFGDMTTRLLDGLKAKTGGTVCMFDRVNALDDTGGGAGKVQGWGFMGSETDNDTSGGPDTNWRYKALLDFKAGL